MEVNLQKFCNFYFQQAKIWSNGDSFSIGKCNLSVK